MEIASEINTLSINLGAKREPTDEAINSPSAFASKVTGDGVKIERNLTTICAVSNYHLNNSLSAGKVLFHSEINQLIGLIFDG